MNVLKQFELNIHKNRLFSKQDKLLLAFSGGVDSVVLSELLLAAGYNFDLAHCNFQLRGTEATNDTHFCETYAARINKHCHVIFFDTAVYAHEHKLSIQMAARELRYKWFDELCHNHGYDYVLTAHHASDNTETLLVNLTRGTGLKGLQGIPEKQGKLVRPLLFAGKPMILDYASQNKLVYREDSSNAEVKYKRNFIRHTIIPGLKQLNPALEETLGTSIHFFKQNYEIVRLFAESRFKDICTETPELLRIDIEQLMHEPQKETLLFEWLYPKDFRTTQIEQLVQVLRDENNTGKQFNSKTHRLVVNRKEILIQPNTTESVKTFVIKDINDTKHLPLKLTFTEVKERQALTNNLETDIEFTEDLFPLTLRRWKQGDKFRPLGMKGFKKLSDFFKDKKLSLFEKEQAWILESHGEIIWIVGYRLDDRFKVNDDSKRVLHIKANSKYE